MLFVVLGVDQEVHGQDEAEVGGPGVRPLLPAHLDGRGCRSSEGDHIHGLQETEAVVRLPPAQFSRERGCEFPLL